MKAKRKTTGDRKAFIAKANAKMRGDEPTIHNDNYEYSLANYFNYHNEHTDIKDAAKWAIQYLSTFKSKNVLSFFKKASDYELRQIGLLGRLKMNDEFLDEKDEIYLTNKISALEHKYKDNNTDAKDNFQSITPTISVKDRVISLADEYIGEIDGALDDFVTDSKQFSMKSFAASNNISGQVAKVIAEAYVPLKNELKLALSGKDDDLKEGYSFLGKSRLKKYIECVENIIADCAQQVVTAKTTRKPRIRKAKPAHVLVAKLKFLNEFKELNLTSVKPSDIIGAKEAWFFDTVKRKVAVYYALEDGLTVKGTTILDYDTTKSSLKHIRKPEDFFKEKFNRKSLGAKYKNINSKEFKPNGRINDKMIIVGAF